MNLGGMGNQAAGSAIQQQIAASASGQPDPTSESHELPEHHGAAGTSGSMVNDPNEMVVSLGGAARSAGLMSSMAAV
jgi:hypothetical protein